MNKRYPPLFLVLLTFIAALFIPLLPVQAEAYWPPAPDITAEAGIIMDADSGTILYEKNVHGRYYPASITKILTTLLALENSTPSEQVTFSYDAVWSIDRSSTHIARDVGEVMTMEQCLYGVMLASANECAYAVAEQVGGGDVGRFVQMMNDRVAQLGLTDTHFNNPHGLPDDAHYTSPYDMAAIAREAMQNESFRIITGTKQYTIPPTNKHSEETPLMNHHKMLAAYNGDASQLYPYCIGGKTGFTEVARSTLVTFAEKDGMTLICVVMKDEGVAQYTDTKALFNYCFDNFQIYNPANQENHSALEGLPKAEFFGTSESIIKLSNLSRVILPKGTPLEDTVTHVEQGRSPEGNPVVSLIYSYDGRAVGRADLEIKNSQGTLFPFGKTSPSADAPQTEASSDLPSVFTIKLEYILLGLLILAVIAGSIFGIRYLEKNFHFMRHKSRMRRKEKSAYKEIRPAKRSKWSKWKL